MISTKPEIQNYQKNNAKGVAVDSMKDNMSLSTISFASLTPKNDSWN
jgi:hypothetical protein